MMDYTELVKELRSGCGLPVLQDKMNRAADTIEELEGRAAELAAIVNSRSENLVCKIVEHDGVTELSVVPRWIPVMERLPENNVHVLLSCRTYGGNKYVCDGFHTEKFSTPTEFYEDIDADYNEEADEYVILKAEKDEDGELMLVTIEDDDEFDRVADYFDAHLEEIIDFDADDAE